MSKKLLCLAAGLVVSIPLASAFAVAKPDHDKNKAGATPAVPATHATPATPADPKSGRPAQPAKPAIPATPAVPPFGEPPPTSSN